MGGGGGGGVGVWCTWEPLIACWVAAKGINLLEGHGTHI